MLSLGPQNIFIEPFRYVAVCMSRSWSRYRTIKRGLVVCLLVWVLSICCMLPINMYAYVHKSVENGQCFFMHSLMSVNISFLIFLYPCIYRSLLSYMHVYIAFLCLFSMYIRVSSCKSYIYVILLLLY